MFCVARHARAYQMFSEITVCHYLRKGLSYFNYLLHVVTQSWKLQCYHAVLVGYGLARPNLSEIINGQYSWKGLSDFIDFLEVVIYMLLDIVDLILWDLSIWRSFSQVLSTRVGFILIQICSSWISVACVCCCDWNKLWLLVILLSFPDIHSPLTLALF